MHKFSYLIFQVEYEKKCCFNYSPFNFPLEFFFLQTRRLSKSSKFPQFEIVNESSNEKRMFPKRFFKNWRARSVHEPRRDRSAKLARRPARRTPPSLTSTSGRCEVTDEASSCVVPTPASSNPGKGGPSSSATRRQSSLLTPQSRFSRCKDRSECQITARQRRQRRLFLLSLRRRLLLIN